MKKLILITALLATSTLAHADFTVKDGRGRYGPLVGSELLNNDSYLLGLITGRIAGMAEANYKDKKECIPAGILLPELVVIVKEYITHHKEVRHTWGYILVSDALEAEYPCPKI